MKRLYKVLAAMFTLALVLAAPDMAITSHAMGFVGDWDGGYEDTGIEVDDDYWGGSSDSGSSNDSAPSYSAPSDNSGSSDSGHHDSGSSDNGNSYDNGSYTDSGSSDNGNGGASSAPAKNPNDMTVSAAGGQPFRIVMNSAHTAYDIYHCGIKQGTVTVTDAEGNPVAYKNIAVEQGDDGLNYVNITFAEGVDTSKLTVTIGNTCASYLAQELGVSGLKVNGTVVLSTVAAK